MISKQYDFWHMLIGQYSLFYNMNVTNNECNMSTNMILIFITFWYGANICFQYFCFRFSLWPHYFDIFDMCWLYSRPPCDRRKIYPVNYPTISKCSSTQIFIHTVTADVRCSHPGANITDISCWAGLHLQSFLWVNVFGDNWPSSARRCSDESSPLLGRCCTWVTVWCSGVAVLCVIMYQNGVTVWS